MDNKTVKNKLLRLQSVDYVPEINLYLSDTPHFKSNSTDRFECWPFAWVGGQALARYVLDNPEIVAGKTVIDLASGSGITAIAAKKAGAARVIAVDDYDPCIECIEMNAKINNVDIEIIQQDVYNYSSTCDLFLLRDPFFDNKLFPYLKGNFGKILVGSPIRQDYYATYMTSPIKTYRIEIPEYFDDRTEYNAHIWWLNE